MSFFPNGFQKATRRSTPWGTRPYTLDYYRGWDAIASLEEDWIRLTRIHPDPVPGVTWEAVKALRQIGLSRGEPLAVGLRMDDRIEAILPFTSRRWLGGVHLRFLGGALLHRHEPLLSPEVCLIPAGLLLKRVASQLGRSVLFDLTGLRPNGFGADWLRNGLASVPGWYISKGARETTVDLKGGWDSVRVAVPRGLRLRAEQGEERAGRSGEFRVSFTAQPTPEELGQLFALSRRQGGFLDTRPGRVLECLVSESALRGRILLGRLNLLHALAAGTISWVLGGEVVELFSVEDTALADHAPAAVMRIRLLERLADDLRVQKLSLLPGRPDEVSDLSPIPLSQHRIWGAPFPGIARVAAQLGDWYSQNRAICEPPLRRIQRLLNPPGESLEGQTRADRGAEEDPGEKGVPVESGSLVEVAIEPGRVK